jgi:hypothetical protein
VPPVNTNMPATPYVASQTTPNMARTPTSLNPKKGITKGAKVGIGLGIAALIGTGAYFMFRKKDNKSKSNSKAQASSEKKTLGKIELI